jgi:outer membrane lipase/esterase
MLLDISLEMSIGSTSIKASQRLRRRFGKQLSVCVLLATAWGAQAQSYFSELVVFGDSLLDSGNYGFDRRATNQLADGSGQFAKISPQFLAEFLGLDLLPAIEGGTNYAVGGYQTQDVLDSINGPGINTAFFGGGTSPSYLDQRANQINPRALVFINGGGNDLNAIFASVAPAAVPASISERVGNFNAAVMALNQAGANYIMVSNVPDLALTPGPQAAFAAGFYNAAAMASISASTDGFNTLLAMTSSGSLAANIIPVDLDGALKFIMANADAYGIAKGVINGLDQRFMCYNGGSGGCFEHPLYGLNGAAPDPRKLVFNDALHPTEITSEIVGDYLIDIVAAPGKIGLLPELGFSAAIGQAQITTSQLRQSRWGKAKPQLFVATHVANAEVSGVESAETDNSSLFIGRTFAASEAVTYGFSASLGKQELDLDNTQLEADHWGVNGMLGLQSGNLFVESQVGLAVLAFDGLRRDIKLGAKTVSAVGDTDGYALNLEILTGLNLLSSSTWKFGPAVGVQLARSLVKGYAESGGEISNYRWNEQKRDRQILRVGLIAKGALSERATLFAEIFAGKDFADKEFRVGIQNTQLLFSEYSMPALLMEDQFEINVNVGSSIKIGTEGSVEIYYSYSDRSENAQSLSVGYSMVF